jgi:hypothetical protein
MKIVGILMQVIGGGLLLALVAVIIRRRLHREYPFFFAYTIFSLLVTVTLLLASGNYKAYLYGYWISEAFGVVFVLFALNEAFYDVFYSFYSFWWFRLIFPGAAAAMALLAIRDAILKPFARIQLFMWVILSVESALSIFQAGIFLAFLLLALGLRLQWRRYPFYIALGFALSGAGDWIAQALLSQFGTRYMQVVRYLPAMMYICATLVWLVCFSRKLQYEPKLKFGATSRRDSPTDAGSTPKLETV